MMFSVEIGMILDIQRVVWERLVNLGEKGRWRT